MGVRLLSLCGGENDESVRWGGCGKRESENVEAVCVVRASLDPVEDSQGVENGGRCDGLVFTVAKLGGVEVKLVMAEGFGNLFRELK
jgi:hypothetical protein